MEKTENANFIDNVVEGMRKSALELEKFQLQLNLGKVEAMDKFNELKKSFIDYTHELKIKTDKSKAQFVKLQGKLQDLQVQLALGKAVSREAFQKQKKKILLAIHELQVTIKSNPTFIKVYAVFLEYLEAFKIKLDMLSEKLEPVKEKVTKAISAKKKDIEKIINSFRKNVDKKTKVSNRMEIFQDEIALAFNHFRKAFVQS